jgi:hypothetical protein
MPWICLGYWFEFSLNSSLNPAWKSGLLCCLCSSLGSWGPVGKSCLSHAPATRSWRSPWSFLNLLRSLACPHTPASFCPSSFSEWPHFSLGWSNYKPRSHLWWFSSSCLLRSSHQQVLLALPLNHTLKTLLHLSATPCERHSRWEQHLSCCVFQLWHPTIPAGPSCPSGYKQQHKP